MRKKFMVKNFRLSKLQTITNCSISCGNKIFVCLIFVVPGIRRKFFYAEFFPNHSILQIRKYAYNILKQLHHSVS